MQDLNNIKVTSSPHIKTREDTKSIMIDVIISLLPALAVSMFIFGSRAIYITAAAVIFCVLMEFICNKVFKTKTTITDLSAVVTGILLAYNLPVTAPIWLVLVGSGFAIVIVKMLYGGIGKNFMNPALAARAFLFSWPGLMSAWVQPFSMPPIFGELPVDAVASATPLAHLKSGVLPSASAMEMALGQIAGCIGEVSAIALIAGGIYLVLRKVITPIIPLSYILTVAVITFIFPQNGLDRLDFMVAHVLSGGLILGAIFMATDYTTSPVTRNGQIVFGIGCGLLTIFIRYFGSYNEGVSYAILIMNTLVWLIDKYTRPRIFGHKKSKKEVSV